MLHTNEIIMSVLLCPLHFMSYSKVFHMYCLTSSFCNLMHYYFSFTPHLEVRKPSLRKCSSLFTVCTRRREGPTPGRLTLSLHNGLLAGRWPMISSNYYKHYGDNYWFRRSKSMKEILYNTVSRDSLKRPSFPKPQFFPAFHTSRPWQGQNQPVSGWLSCELGAVDP